jgi:hypothetical protein
MFRYPTFIVFAGLLGISFGLPLLVAPRIFLALNGATTDTTGLWLARLAGGTLIEAGLTQVLLAPLNDGYVQKRVLLAGLVGSTIILTTMLSIQLIGLTGSFGWVNVAVSGALILGFFLTFRSIQQDR